MRYYLSAIRIFRPVAERKVNAMANQINNPAHTVWMSRYHLKVCVACMGRGWWYGKVR